MIARQNNNNSNKKARVVEGTEKEISIPDLRKNCFAIISQYVTCVEILQSL